jgi:hypothetical protein
MRDPPALGRRIEPDGVGIAEGVVTSCLLNVLLRGVGVAKAKGTSSALPPMLAECPWCAAYWPAMDDCGRRPSTGVAPEW